VNAYFNCDSRFEGYSGFVHGGIVSSLLDGAMTNCMFALGQTPLTAELKVRFRHPILIGQPAIVRAWIDHRTPRLYSLEAEILQENLVKARAWGKFIDGGDR
jgi:acyl-coenzyme A thioesterase PaaI-like protein